MKNVFSLLKRAILWQVDCLAKAPSFPLWCDTGEALRGKNQAPRRSLGPDGAVVWQVAGDRRLPHYDHIEMSGFSVSCIASYGVDGAGRLRMHRHGVFPMLRTIPNDTHASLSHNFLAGADAAVVVGGRPIGAEFPRTIALNGSLVIQSDTDRAVTLERKLLPSVHHPAIMERITVANPGAQAVDVEVRPPHYRRVTRKAGGVGGSYELRAGVADASGRFDSDVSPALRFRLEPGGNAAFYQVYCALRAGEHLAFDAAGEERHREAFLRQMRGALRLETPEPVLNGAFEFAKIRVCESIFKTKNGLMHSPGGGSYYAALWTNDQCEYANPLFPFVGYGPANEQAANCYRLYMERMDPALAAPLVTSIIAEGEGTWNGAGDRGDGAMFAYGAARYALAMGDAALAARLWGGIVWGIEFSLRKRNAHGVIASDSDELENRFESGDANLCTSCLVYDALRSAVYLGQELGRDLALLRRYRDEAKALREAIEAQFGARVQGFDTYRYYEGNDVLRAWICVPLSMGIFDRAEETVRALLSDALWTDDGLRSQAGCDTFWDRSTLYCLRSVFAAGKPRLALEHLLQYSRRRLLGEHAPYPVEAWPEGNQRHLAAESGLYLRVYTEGLFGIRPMGFRRFELRPQLPPGWQGMALRDVMAFGSRFDVEVSRQGRGVRVAVRRNGVVVWEQELIEGKAAVVTLD